MQLSTPRHRLIFRVEDFQNLKQKLFLNSTLETAAVVFARAVPTVLGGWRLLAADVLHPADEDYRERTEIRISLTPEFVNRVFEKARSSGHSVFWTHTHPGGLLQPSSHDLAGEQVMVPRLRYHAPGIPHGRLIFADTGLHAALFLPDDTEVPLEVQSVGQSLQQHTALETQTGERFDRQILAFGEEGQHKLQQLRVAVVGAGGTGSLTLQQLAHLGVRHFYIFEPDLVDTSNLNRLVGASPEDVGRTKADVAQDMILRINPEATVTLFTGDVTRYMVNRHLLDCDFFMGCTDSHGSREVLSRISYQYHLPGIDMGVAIHLPQNPSQNLRMVGRVQMLAAGLPCLLCCEVLDPEQVRRDMQTELERKTDPYFMGEGTRVHQPAVISLNSTVAGLAVSMFLAATTGIPVQPRSQQVDFNRGLVRSTVTEPMPECPHCAAHLALGQGDEWQRPGRP